MKNFNLGHPKFECDEIYLHKIMLINMLDFKTEKTANLFSLILVLVTHKPLL